MLRVGVKELQVFDAVVGRVSVAMMHNLGATQSTPNMGFHYQAMFADVTVAICLVMLWPQYQPVATLVKEATAFPPRVFSPRRPSVRRFPIWR